MTFLKTTRYNQLTVKPAQGDKHLKASNNANSIHEKLHSGTIIHQIYEIGL